MDDSNARPRLSVPIGAAVRRVFRKGYGLADLRADVFAGLVVGVVALPLSMALAIAVGAPPQHGLYTAIFAGSVTALLGGSKFQVTGPTAAFVVILAPIVSRHGLSGLLTAGFLAGILLVVLGVARLGSLIRFVPYPVTTGFTTGIAVVIATLQIKDVLGLKLAAMPEPYHEKVWALWQARGTLDPRELVVAAATLLLLLLLPKVIQKVPAPLLAIGAVAAGVAAAHALWPGFEVATIGSRFQSTVDGVEVAGIPPVLPRPALPWSGLHLDFEHFRALLPAAFAIAVLGAIESLLSSVVADGMTGTRHDPNSELVGQGIGNIVAPFFGGIAATGALARTATAIRAGARSPFAAVTHALVVLAAMLFLAPLVAYIPMASLAALLLLVAWNMSEIRHFIGVVRIAPKGDVFVLLTCFLLTVVFDMVWAVSVGFLLAAVLFMRRMAELTESGFAIDATEEDHALPKLPPGVAIYEVNGPLFFGAAHQAMEALHASHGDTFHTLILDLARVPVIDATGFAALGNTIRALHARGKRVVLAGPLPQPARIWERAAKQGRTAGIIVAVNREAALAQASARATLIGGGVGLRE
ncbi:MAG: C4-dicarboxylic acid transporter DauA [Pseudomonadota bacterium]|nr:C4-dicarboxylic acid transporter DauA [Pseudomonadota bacterium]